MLSLSLIKRYLQRHHRTLGTLFIVIGLITFFLDQNYRRQQRDLYFWLNLLIRLFHQPYWMCGLAASIILPLLIQQRVFDIMFGFVAMVVRKYRKAKYADFIMRRLLLQLELAYQCLPEKLNANQLNDPEVRQRYQQAKDAAYCAVNIFRRDAAPLLYVDTNARNAGSSFFVLKEEEQALLRAGYARISLRVTQKLLWHLLYPQARNVA